MSARSLTRQTIASVILAQLFCAIALSGTALLHEWQIRTRAFDVMLQGRSDSLLGSIQDAEDPDDNVIIDPSELRLPAQDVYAVYNQGDRNQGGRLLGASSDAPGELVRRRDDGFTTLQISGHSYRVLQRSGMRVIDRAENRGVGLRRPVTIVYAVRSDHIWHEVLEAARFYVVLSVLLIATSSGLMLVLLRRVLQPIEKLADAARGISVRSLEFNAPSSALRISELQPLTSALSATVQGLRQAFEKQHRFVGDAAHELKTAIAVTRSSIQLMMLRPRAVVEYESGLRRTFEDIERVEALIAQMLTLARLEEQDVSGTEATDIAAVTNSSVSRLRLLAEEHAICVKLTNGTHAQVRLSEEEIDVLVSNLLMNAIQHSAAAGEVNVSITEKDKTVILTVRDCGEGISPEALPHVFERFYREDRSRSRETGGAGLGLAICKSIVESARGCIEIQSELGAGTTATVTLPSVATAMFSLSGG